jgi:type VI secretion system secreted protein Hcp
MAVDLYLCVDGLTGGTQDSKMSKRKAADVRSFNWGVSNTGNWHKGSGGTLAKADVQNISIVKETDTMSPGLVLACTLGTHINKASLICRKAGGPNQVEYFTFDMSGVIISSVETGAQLDDERHVERVTLAFRQFSIKFVEQSPTGGAGAPVIVTYDVAAQKVA